ncbi:MAG: hypothetical protein ABJJ05_13670 [Maribacter litoralis]|uniref:hypothetical protein n=1 Tax=Maribacter litoralis TaxID=2059726 RepID=UPI0032973985
MGHCKYLLVLLLAIFIMFAGCEKEEIEQTDNLDPFGILGQWKLETKTINGITDSSIQCCDYIDFKTDSELNDLKGEFMATGEEYETNGVFELNTLNNLIHFEFDNTQKSYEFRITDNLATFTYFENNQEVIEDWRKQE